MRTAFFALLFANLAFLAWAGWVDTPQQAKAADPNAHLPRLKLVSEAQAGQRAAPDNQAADGSVRKMTLTTPAAVPGAAGVSPSLPLPPAADPARCVSLGPFNDVDAAARAAGALRASGFAPQQRARPGETWDGFWVYIGNVADVAAAGKVIKTLERNGIQDARLMPGAEEGRRISVGLFSERARAQRRAKAIEKLGFAAEVQERTQPGTEYWVDLTLRPSDNAIPVHDLLAAGGGSSRLSVEACPAKPGPGTTSPRATSSGTTSTAKLNGQPVITPQTQLSPDPAPAGARAPAPTVASAPRLH